MELKQHLEKLIQNYPTNLVLTGLNNIFIAPSQEQSTILFQQKSVLDSFVAQNASIPLTSSDFERFKAIYQNLQKYFKPFAIINYGSVMIYQEENEQGEMTWNVLQEHQDVCEQQFQAATGLERLAALSYIKIELDSVAQALGLNVSVKLDNINGVEVPCYVHIKGLKDCACDESKRFREKLQRFWFDNTSLMKHFDLHINSNSLAIIPMANTKFMATKMLKENLKAIAPNTSLVGIGYSTFDLPFLNLMDYSILANNINPSANNWIGKMMRASPTI